MDASEDQQVLEAKLKEIRDRLDQHFARLQQGEERMNAFETKLDKNNAMTGRIEENTKDLLDIFSAFEGFVKVGGWVGGVVKWTAALVIAVGVLIWVWKTGNLPTKNP